MGILTCLMKDTSSGGKLNLFPMEKVIAEEKLAV